MTKTMKRLGQLLMFAPDARADRSRPTPSVEEIAYELSLQGGPDFEVPVRDMDRTETPMGVFDLARNASLASGSFTDLDRDERECRQDDDVSDIVRGLEDGEYFLVTGFTDEEIEKAGGAIADVQLDEAGISFLRK